MVLACARTHAKPFGPCSRVMRSLARNHVLESLRVKLSSETLSRAFPRVGTPWYETFMYGEMDSDPVVAYYDIAFGLTGKSERRFYVDLMNRCGGPILDLAGGTGRFTLAAATAGYPVTYIDASPGMHQRLNTKIEALPARTAALIETQMAAMWEFDTHTTYQLVICVDAFFHLLTPEHARAALSRIRASLNEDGLFAFNTHYTTPTFLCFAASPNGAEWNTRGKYPIPQTEDQLEVQQALAVDYSTQVIVTKLRFLRTRSDGSLVSTTESEWQTRYYNRNELEYLLELSDLDVISVQGTYDGDPVAEGSQLIYVCRQRRR